jgi:Glycosyltransferase family 92
MDEDRWERLLEFLRRAWSSPTFDSEERAYRLEIVEELRRVIRLASEREPWTEPFDAILTGVFRGRRYDLTEWLHRRWIRNLPAAESFGLALGSFLDPGPDPILRFTSFVQAAEEQQPELKAPAEQLASPDPDRDAVLSFGSLLNFACSPEDLPIVRPDAWNLVQQTLGYESIFRRSPLEHYERHLDFARDVEHRLREARIEVRDMLDTQSLIHIAGMQPDFWAADPRTESRPGDRSRTRSPGPSKPYLSICAIYRDEADYLAEWIEFHRLVGVERFLLYNNFSEDHHLEVLAPYREEGIVSVRDWPVLDGRVGQIPAYNDCLRWHRYDSRWIAFIDLDEFLFSPTGEPLPEVLSEYEQWPGVAVRWAMFGTSGHRTKPSGLVIENYRSRIAFDGGINMKTVADPTRVTACISAHHFAYPYLSAVDENHLPMTGTRTASDSVARLRLNHYHWKSEEEYVAKCARMRAIGRPREVPTAEHFEWLRAAEAKGNVDDTILMYAPALRDALAARESERAGAR